jgi:hypothetical protein
MSIQRDSIKRLGEDTKIGLALAHATDLSPVTGEVFIEMVDATTGAVLHKEHRKNVITLDAGILVAILLRDPDSRTHGFNMLSVGTGASGALLSPDAPDSGQRKLNAEIARKPWKSTTFRDANGDAVAIPTNIVDYTCTFDEGEAVGPLNEMGIQSTISANPAAANWRPNPNVFPTRDVTVDLSLYDILGNYLTFSVISKPNTARLTITWRITC